MIRRKFRPGAFGIFASGLVILSALAWNGSSGAATTAKTRVTLDQRYAATVRPFLQSYCVGCHGKQSPQAQLDLTAFPNMAAVTRDYAHWTLLLDKLTAKQMPPPSSGIHIPPAQRQAVIAWVRDMKQFEEQRNAGDPGSVLARRLSNAEYDYTIRDLTGVDLRPTREFPVDPANQEGFDNSGESLTLSPALIKKYMQAAKSVADDMALTSRGMEFAPYPVEVETDRDKFCILRIVNFYKRQPTDYADYFQAAWRYKNRVALGEPSATLPSVAAEAKISSHYLELVWNTLNAPGGAVGPIAKLQDLFNGLPQPDKGRPDVARAGCVAMRDWVTALRKKLAWHFDNLHVPGGFSAGGQCFVLWKDRQYASHRRMLYTNNLQPGGTPPVRTIPARRRGSRTQPAKTITDPVDSDLYLPREEAARAPWMASYSQFCNVFPDAFYISERGRMFEDDPSDQGRLLSAGLHNSMGVFRDDQPLMDLLLDDKGRDDLNHLWLDFDEIAFIPERMHREFFVYERAEAGTINDPEFNFVRAEDPDSTSDAKIQRLANVYLAKARRNGGEPMAIQAIEDHFKWVSQHIRATEKARLAAEPVHLKAMLDFARRAYRRPLTDSERTGLLAFYQSLRKTEGLTHEEAVRDTVASILMDPKFLFRLDLETTADSPVASGKAQPGAHTVAAVDHASAPPAAGNLQPLSDYALASRLSYFIWSSMPDDELLSHAAAGDLHRPEVLEAQAHRMLRDPKARALALEFLGNWLDFRRFEEYNGVDRNRFPAWSDDLREAMFEEPLHFMMDDFQNGRSVLDMLYGKYTFVNAALAKHYGMTGVKPAGDQWVRVDDADRYGRGGLLPMGVFLTKNSPGLRTSPVKRGYWVVRRLLGEYIPPPPATVPALPTDESKMGNLTLRQALEEHRKNPACAACHAHFDSYGLVFEGYGPTGELRTRDLGGKLVDTRAPFPGGIERSGVAGLEDFIHQQRQKDFLDTLGHKLLSYALGRSLLPSDNPSLREMQQRLASGGYRFETLVDTVVSSRQFRYRRAMTTLARN